jgi:protein TonB
LQKSPIVILSTATPPGGAYHWNDSNPSKPVILSEGGDYSQPKVIHYEPPHYSPEMRKAGISGPVVASLLIDKTGVVREVEIVKSPADELSAAATEAVEQWIFEPATKDGEPVDVRFMVTVMFRLK